MLDLIRSGSCGGSPRAQLDLFGTTARQRRLEVAIDQLTERFGPDVVHRANDAAMPLGLASDPDFLDERKRR
jgi:hypothetical protein